jgi:radical SAM superfamily enzyme YgiQ (UPF0313 family)
MGVKEVILVNPPETEKPLYAVSDEQYMFPYSIVYLCNYLALNGVKSKAYDLYNSEPNELIEYCKGLSSPIIGMTSQSATRDIAIDIIRKIKKVNPSAITIVGGKHFSWCSEDTLAHIKEIDIVARGEGENLLYELVQVLREDGDLGQVDGITYRKSGEIIFNKDRKPEVNIDKFSLNYDLLKANFKAKDFSKGVYMRNFVNEKLRALPVLLGRGCSQRCAFCSFRMIPYRARSLGSVLKEIRYLKDTYNYKHFSFTDPSFCERKSFVRELCEQFISEKFDIKWYCEARVDTPDELLELMVRAGCISLDFAIESGSDKVLKAIRKRINVSQALDFAKKCKEMGLRSLVFFMISLPEETESDALQTYEVAREVSEYTKYISYNVGLVLPGTEFETIAKEKEILPRDFSWYDTKYYHNYSDLGPQNIPLYLENLSIDFIRGILKKFEKIKYSNYSSGADFVRMFRRGLRKIPKQTFSQNARDVSRFFKGLWYKVRK